MASLHFLFVRECLRCARSIITTTKFYRPPYVGGAGWVGIELPRVSDKELTAHLREAWKLIAPEKLQTALL